MGTYQSIGRLLAALVAAYLPLRASLQAIWTAVCDSLDLLHILRHAGDLRGALPAFPFTPALALPRTGDMQGLGPLDGLHN